MSNAENEARVKLRKEADNFYLARARRQIIDGSLEQAGHCQQALLSAGMFNEAGDAEMTGKLLRVARQYADEFNRQITGFDPA